jgi:hypothetical protein
MEWNLIESAPKDESAFLAFDPIACAVVSARFDKQRGEIVHTWDEAGNPDFTHWCPLPPPPFEPRVRLKPDHLRMASASLEMKILK